MRRILIRDQIPKCKVFYTDSIFWFYSNTLRRLLGLSQRAVSCSISSPTGVAVKKILTDEEEHRDNRTFVLAHRACLEINPTHPDNVAENLVALVQTCESAVKEKDLGRLITRVGIIGEVLARMGAVKEGG